jgi:hypothetical protein
MILTHFVGSLECQLCQRLATPLDAMRRLELQRGSQTTMIWVANDDDMGRKRRCKPADCGRIALRVEKRLDSIRVYR